MPTISVTQAEFDAIMFYKEETMDKAENAEDEQYLSDYAKHCEVFSNFRKKYHNAKNRENNQKVVRKLLKNAKKSGIEN
jgi:hypothetical protein